MYVYFFDEMHTPDQESSRGHQMFRGRQLICHP